MTRVSVAEMYDDKDVITQICKLKDTVNAYAGGIITDIDVSGNDLVIDWADGTSISLPLPDPVTGISSITGSVSGGNLTITFYFTNGTTHSLTCPLNGMASEAYVNAGLATKADAADVYTKAEVDNHSGLYKKTVITDGATLLQKLQNANPGDFITWYSLEDGVYTCYQSLFTKSNTQFWIGGTTALLVSGITYRVGITLLVDTKIKFEYHTDFTSYVAPVELTTEDIVVNSAIFYELQQQ